MRRKQIASLLVLACIWLTTCGFVSWGEAGIAQIVEPMTSEDFDKLAVIEEWGNRCMANVKEYVTIRTEANAEAEAVGRLYKGGAAEILEQGEEWTKVVSGDCEGYIANQYLAFGKEAKAVAERDCSFVATITADTLKVRSEASEESKTKDLIGFGEKVNVQEEVDGWLKIEYGEESAYIKAEYASVEFEVGEAQTMEQIRAAVHENMQQTTKLFQQSDEFTHRENVKVYRNVQAVVVEENSKQTENITAAVKKLRGKLNGILGVSIAALIISLGSLVIQILNMMNFKFF